MSAVVIINFKYDGKAPKVVYNQAVAHEDQVGLDTLTETLTNLLPTACRWAPLTVAKVADMNTQLGRLNHSNDVFFKTSI